jgi:hypothetical protein
MGPTLLRGFPGRQAFTLSTQPGKHAPCCCPCKGTPQLLHHDGNHHLCNHVFSTVDLALDVQNSKQTVGKLGPEDCSNTPSNAIVSGDSAHTTALQGIPRASMRTVRIGSRVYCCSWASTTTQPKGCIRQGEERHRNITIHPLLVNPPPHSNLADAAGKPHHTAYSTSCDSAQPKVGMRTACAHVAHGAPA